jgi:hypothetical protein
VLTLVLVTLALIVGWVGLEVYLAYTSKPAIKVNYGEKLRELAEEWQVGGEENAWPVLLEVIEIHNEKLASFRDEETGWDWLSTAYGYDAITNYGYYMNSIDRGYFQIDGSSEKGKQLVELHRKWAFESITSFGDLGILDRLDTIAGSKYALMQIPDSRLPDSQFALSPVYGEARAFVRSLEATMMWSASRGDWQRYELAFEHCLAIGRIVMMQPSMSARIAGAGIRGVAMVRLREHLIDGAIPSSIVPDLREAYLRQAILPPKRYSLEAGRLVSLDELQLMFTASGRFIPVEFSRHLVTGTAAHWSYNMTSIWQPRWTSASDEFIARYDRCMELVEMPRWQRTAQPEYRSWSYAGDGAAPDSLSDWMDHSVSAGFYGSVCDMQDASERGAALMLAIESFAYEKGRFPASLEELVPEYLDELPLDPYAMDPKIWQYRLLDGSTQDGRPYVLYSVGIDGDDDGGLVPAGKSPGAALSVDIVTGDEPDMDYVVTAKFRLP